MVWIAVLTLGLVLEISRDSFKDGRCGKVRAMAASVPLRAALVKMSASSSIIRECANIEVMNPLLDVQKLDDGGVY